MKRANGCVSQSFYKDYQNAQEEKRNQGKCWHAYCLKKNGEPYKNPSSELFGPFATKEEAEQEGQRLAKLNPGKTFIPRECEIS